MAVQRMSLTVYEGADWNVKARVQDEDGANVFQAAIDSMDVHVFKLEGSSPQTEVYKELAISVSDWDQSTGPSNHVTIMSTALSTTGWDKDDTGFNLDFYLSITELLTGGADGSGTISEVGAGNYLVEGHLNRATASTQGPIVFLIDVKVKALRSL